MPLEPRSLRFPLDLCANCGDRWDLEYEIVSLVSGRFGFEAELPFCIRCRPTATRQPPRPGTGIAGGVFFAAMAGVALTSLGGAGLGTLLLLLIAGGLSGYAVRSEWPARPPQTSRYAPLRLDYVVFDAYSGKPSIVTVRATNASYAGALRALNPDPISNGDLVIKG